MNTEFLATTVKKSSLDPRTKLTLLVAIAVVVLGGAGGEKMLPFSCVLSIIPFVLLMCSGKIMRAVIGIFALSVGYLLQYIILPCTTGVVNFLVLLTAGIVIRLTPGLTMGTYALSTTTVSEFTAAFQRMHITDKLTIPLSVMFRFFPTVMEEFTSINAAMRMRGIKFGGKNFLKAIEYRAVPMMACSVKIGEELSASALTRGLGGPKKRTNICEIGFHALDYVFLVFVFLMTFYGLFSALGVIL
ncbi:MAG: energy-coupling factor transporter transmembrane component T [Acutalibacteraceae bacterium]